MLEIVTVPALEVFENYYFLLHDPASGKTAAVDCGDTGPLLKTLSEKGWGLDEIWLTHHHWDHVDGVMELKETTDADVIGSSAASPNLPPLDIDLSAPASFEFAGHPVYVLPTPGHADGHVVFYLPDQNVLFSGDTLMTLGCGRLLEGTANELWDSLERLRGLPEETMIYSGHEYTMGNAAFALSVDPNNDTLKARAVEIEDMRQKNQPTVPSTLAQEKATNPFLRPEDPQLRATLGMENASNLDVFAELRRRKDNF